MAEYQKWARNAWSQSMPYAQELFSNENYVYTSAVAMNALFAFTPFVILMTSILQYFFPGAGIDLLVYDILEQYLPFTHAPAPPNNQSDLDFIIRNLKAISAGFGKAQFFSSLLLIWSVASVFIPLEMALNRALGVQESRGFWRSQWLALRMVVLLGVVAFTFILGAFATQWVLGLFIPDGWVTVNAIINAINIKVWMVPLTLLVSCIVMYTAPNTRVPFKDVWPAAIFTGLLWEISNYGFVVALPYMGLHAIFGPLTIAVAWMTWVYVGGLILVLGANLMAKRALANQVERMKEALWNFSKELPS
ncbi:MAG TPA: YihY/virulence factor BrkB family protein [Terriglobia bacterium]|nr:YihY/virulence factor BrkB family protein [Terriglobia bacterium]